MFWNLSHDRERIESLMLIGCIIGLLLQDDKVRVVQTLLFVEGINTLVQTLFGTRLPTVIGGSYAFMVPIVSIIRDPSLSMIEDPQLVSTYSTQLIN